MLTPNTILQNRYRIVRELGHGGMGTVYEALDQRVNCIVALKETIAGTSDEARRAFEREASLLGNLRHSSLPKVMDYFSEDGGDFLIMEFIPGLDLAELIEERGTLSQAQVMRWADELLKVLEYLHGQQPPILHRDIKPSNLKLTKQGEMFLLDFGLAKGSLGQMQTLATSRSVRGYTPSYASLEQIHGHGTDARSDIYSLGATLYHLLTGVAPVDAPARFHTIEDDHPDPLPPIQQLNPQASANVAEVIHQAMAVSRKHRPIGATEMRKALRNAAEEDERQSAEKEYARAEARRRKRDEERKRAAEAASRAEEEQRLQEAETRRQQEARGSVEEKRRQEDEAQRQAETTRKRAEERLQAEAEARRQAEVETRRRSEEERRQAEAANYEAGGRARVEQDKRRRAAQVPLTAPAATDRSPEMKRCPECNRTFRSPQKFCTYDRRVLEVVASGHRDAVDAERSKQTAGPSIEQKPTSSDPFVSVISPTVIPALPRPVRPAIVNYKPESSFKRKGKAKSLFVILAAGIILAIGAFIWFQLAAWNRTQSTEQRAAKPMLASTALENTALGDALFKQRRFVEAEAYHREALRLQPANAGHNNDLGNDLYSQQRYPEAEPYYREAVRLKPGESVYQFNLGIVLNVQKKYSEAESYLREAVRLKPGDADNNNNLGDALYYQQKSVEAEPYYREALRLQPANADHNNDLGNDLYSQQKYPEAEPYYREAVRLKPGEAGHQFNLGIVLNVQKKYSEAESYLREAVRLKPSNADFNNSLGDALYYQQKYAEAGSYYREALRLDPGNKTYQKNAGKTPSQ